MFELLGIRLVHGWVIENNEEKKAIEELTYNQAVDLVITQPGDRADLIKRFFDNSPSQLTSKGLRMIESGLDEEEVAVFFRNNHFSTIIKSNGIVYLLATDVAFIEAEGVVWERLEQINGNNLYCNSFFIPLEPTESLLYETKRVSQSFEEVKRTSVVRKFGDQKVMPESKENEKVEVKNNENKNDQNKETEAKNEKLQKKSKENKSESEKDSEIVDSKNKSENNGEGSAEEKKGGKELNKEEIKSDPSEQQVQPKKKSRKCKKDEGCCLIF